VKECVISDVQVMLELGHDDDSDLDLVLKTESIPLELTPGGVIGGAGTIGGFGISVKEATRAENVVYWPPVSIRDPDRREIINKATREALRTAEGLGVSSVGLFTMGLEVSRIPSWEVAEEIVKGVVTHLKEQTALERIFLVASSPMQVSSFEYVLLNHSIVTSEEE
jgi:hypothetical protein